MNTNLKTQNANIAKAMQAKATKTVHAPAKADARSKFVNAKAVKPAPTAAPKTTAKRAPVAKSTVPTVVPAVETKSTDVRSDQPTIRPSDELTRATLSTDTPTQNGQHLILRAGTLKAALNAVERACAKKSTIPVLSHILMETVGNAGIKLTATNLDFTLWQFAEAKVIQAGAVCVPPLLADLLAKVNDDLLVTLSTNPKTQIVRVEAGRVTTHIKALDASEFPQANTFNGEAVHLGMDVLHDTIVEITKRIIPFVATDDARPILTGIGVSARLPKHSGEDVTVTFAGADGWRLAYLQREATLHFDAVPSETLSLVLPAKVFGEILKLAHDESKPIQFLFHLRFDKKGVLEMGMVQVETGTGGLRINLLDGTFPDYTQIDKEPPHAPIIPFAVAESVSALERASLFNDASTVRIAPKPLTGHILMQASSAEDGDFQELLTAQFDSERVTEDGYEIAFNARFLSEALKAVAYQDGAKPVYVRVTEPSKPAFLSAPRFRLVVMPMHIGADAAAKPEPKASEPAPAEPAPSTNKETPSNSESPTANPPAAAPVKEPSRKPLRKTSK